MADRQKAIFFLLIVMCAGPIFSQANKTYKPSIEPCNCNFKLDSSYYASVPQALKADSTFAFKIDSSFETLCAYLIVPENRAKRFSKMIKLPFIVLKSKNPAKKKDPFLFTTGGPGGTSLSWINGMQRSTVIENRDCIAFEQRGTHFAIPNLRSFELDTAIRASYRKNLNKDSMWTEGVKRYKKKLESKGIDLSGYTTSETVSDIIDLLTALKIDSVNLTGGSYSATPLLGVVKKAPTKVRSLVLDSPLPNFVRIEEDEPMNFLEGLKVLSRRCETDSLDQDRYQNLFARFLLYFNSIADQKFLFRYLERGSSDTLQIEYTKNELLDVVCSTMQTAAALKDVAFMITEMIRGNHTVYIRKKLDDIFNKNLAPNGMRMSVHCADQWPANKREIIRQSWRAFPLLRGWRINDVYLEVCEAWKVPPVSPDDLQPFYSTKPILMGDGEMDPACRPLYMSLIKHYMPHAKCFLFINKSHGVGGSVFREMTQQFLDQPFQTLVSSNEKVLAY